MRVSSLRTPLGSSPLSRGIHNGGVAPEISGGIIPALAGNTMCCWTKSSCGKDHPRSRGEYVHQSGPVPAGPGSSPLSRGIPGARLQPLSMIRIIPALAGNTSTTPANIALRGDHPRSRGEYVAGGVVLSEVEGSSPLSRGIHVVDGSRFVTSRIIPALAGNTTHLGRGLRPPPDHPRSRGEYLVGYLMILTRRGSSPLSRGILRPQAGGKITGGIIPALAGNTARQPQTDYPTADHPRSRGEYISGSQNPRSSHGSSPLSRGIPRACAVYTGGGRIIPALAGNTSRMSMMFCISSDHPRSRGEYGV